MTAAGMRPGNSRACLSLSQSPSYHVQVRRKGSGLEQQRAAVVKAAVDGSLHFLQPEQPEGSSVVYHKPSAPLSPSVQTQIRHCYYTDSAGYPRGALSQVLR